MEKSEVPAGHPATTETAYADSKEISDVDQKEQASATT
jgi:hypothetical protein